MCTFVPSCTWRKIARELHYQGTYRACWIFLSCNVDIIHNLAEEQLKKRPNGKSYYYLCWLYLGVTLLLTDDDGLLFSLNGCEIVPIHGIRRIGYDSIYTRRHVLCLIWGMYLPSQLLLEAPNGEICGQENGIQQCNAESAPSCFDMCNIRTYDTVTACYLLGIIRCSYGIERAHCLCTVHSTNWSEANPVCMYKLSFSLRAGTPKYPLRPGRSFEMLGRTTLTLVRVRSQRVSSPWEESWVVSHTALRQHTS